MTTIAHLIKTFTLWEFVKAHWLTHLRHAELVSASKPRWLGQSGIIQPRTTFEAWVLKQVQDDGGDIV